MEKNAQRMEDLIERSIDSMTSHPAFLGAVSTLLNVNSYRKIWFRKTMEAILADLELPQRRQQELLLSQIEELNVRIKRLELDLQLERQKKDSIRSSSVNKKTRNIKMNDAASNLEFR